MSIKFSPAGDAADWSHPREVVRWRLVDLRTDDNGVWATLVTPAGVAPPRRLTVLVERRQHGAATRCLRGAMAAADWAERRRAAGLTIEVPRDG